MTKGDIPCRLTTFGPTNQYRGFVAENMYKEGAKRFHSSLAEKLAPESALHFWATLGKADVTQGMGLLPRRTLSAALNL